MRYISPRNIKASPRFIQTSTATSNVDTAGRTRSLLPCFSGRSTTLRSMFSPLRLIILIVSLLIILSSTFTFTGSIQFRARTAQKHQSNQKETRLTDTTPTTKVKTQQQSNDPNSNNIISTDKIKLHVNKEYTSMSKTSSNTNIKVSTSIKQNESSSLKLNTSNVPGPTVTIVSNSTMTRRSRAKGFIIVFLGHSGSTAYITELREHPDFEIELEPLDHGEYQFNTELALKRAREILDKAISKGKIPGFKLRPYHIRNKPKELKALVQEYDLRIFWNFRVNIMKQAIGEYRHRILNDTSVIEGLKKNEKACDKSSGYKCQFRIDDIPALHQLLNDFSKNDEVLGEAVRLLERDDHLMAVKYEDYLYRRKEVMRDTLNFLGVEQQETESLRSKASPDSLCGMVINYQEVCQAFYPCQLWRPYLDDDRNGCYCRATNGVNFNKKYCHRDVWYQKQS